MRLEDQKKARELRSEGWTLPEIAKEVSAGKGLVSLWVRDVCISESGLIRLAQRRERNLATLFGGVTRAEIARDTWSKISIAKRVIYRQEGRLAAKKNEKVAHSCLCSLLGRGHK